MIRLLTIISFTDRTSAVGTKATDAKIIKEGSISRYVHLAEEIWPSHFCSYDGSSGRTIKEEVCEENMNNYFVYLEVSA